MRSDDMNRHMQVHMKRKLFDVSCNICLKWMRSDNLKRHMKLHMNRKLHDKPVKKRKFDEFNELVDVYHDSNFVESWPCENEPNVSERAS